MCRVMRSKSYLHIYDLSHHGFPDLGNLEAGCVGLAKWGLVLRPLPTRLIQHPSSLHLPHSHHITICHSFGKFMYVLIKTILDTQEVVISNREYPRKI